MHVQKMKIQRDYSLKYDQEFFMGEAKSMLCKLLFNQFNLSIFVILFFYSECCYSMHMLCMQCAGLESMFWMFSLSVTHIPEELDYHENHTTLCITKVMCFSRS